LAGAATGSRLDIFLKQQQIRALIRKNGRVSIKYELLGGLRITRDGESVVLRSRIRRKILSVLLVEAGASVSPDRLIDAVWGEDPPSSRERALLFHISRLRDSLEPGRAAGLSEAVKTTNVGYRVIAEPNEVDLFRWISDVDVAADKLTVDTAEALTLLDRLCGAYEDPLPEFAYDEFAMPTIRRAQRQLANAQRMRVDALVTLGRNADAISALRTLHDADPYDEAVVSRLVMALYRAGHQTEALRTYDTTRQRLVGELGIDPGPELEATRLSVLRQDPQLVNRSLNEPPLHNLPAP
jgi:DNA-binding SARP family transcriptional activator